MPTLRMCFLVSVLALSGAVAEEAAWEGSWVAPELPHQSSPSWTYHRGEEIFQAETLNIKSTLEDSTACFSLDADSGNWRPSSDGVTVEFEVRVNSMLGGHACAVTVGGFGVEKDHAYAVFLGEGWVQLENGQRAVFEPGEFHRFRLTATDAEAILYMDGNADPVLRTSLSEKDAKVALYFGDVSAHGGGDVDWKAMKWTDKGAFAP